MDRWGSGGEVRCLAPPLRHRVGSWFGLALGCALFASCSMRQLIYPAPPVPVPVPPPPLEEVDLGNGGEPIIAWHLPAGKTPDRPVVLFLHGNGENLETLRYSGMFDRWAALDAAVLAVDYPGYGRSGGTPSESTVKAAGIAGLDWLAARHPGRPVVVCGWSLGAAVALGLAAERSGSLAGVVVLSPWTSLEEVGRAHYPGWLVSLALSDRYDSLAAARGLALPALVVHGGLDAIIPASHGRQIAEALEASTWVEVPGAGHNDLLGRGEAWREVERFINGLEPALR